MAEQTLTEKVEDSSTENLDFIVSLRGIQIRGTEEYPCGILYKGIKDMRDKTLGEIIEYMLDPSEDELNPAYNEGEIEVKNRIIKLRANAKASEKSVCGCCHYLFQISYLRKENQLSDPIKLQSHISDYPDMIKNVSKRTDTGEEIKYEEIDLIAKLINENREPWQIQI